jgi:hypothetical protein
MRLFSQLFTVVSSLLFVCSVGQSRATGQSRPVLQKTVPRSQTTGSSHSQVPFSIALTALQQRILAGAPVKFQVVTTNTSTQPLDLWVEYTSDLGGWVYRVSVVDGSGNVPASTMRGRTRFEPARDVYHPSSPFRRRIGLGYIQPSHCHCGFIRKHSIWPDS